MKFSPSLLLLTSAMLFNQTASCETSPTAPSVLSAGLKILSADDMAGRRTGSEGSEKARQYILDRIHATDFTGNVDIEVLPFTFKPRKAPEDKNIQGTNILVHLEGFGDSDKSLIVTAHYDHVGINKGEIYNGADDNASGVVAALAVMETFAATPPEHDVWIIFPDAEEMGLQGSRHIAASLSEHGINNPALAINFDMLAQNTKDELFVSGTYHNPALEPFIEQLAEHARIHLLMGHDKPEDGHQDWTMQSDHGSFFKQGIPFLYFGVEDHPHYHKPSDTYENIPLNFFYRSVATVVEAVTFLEQKLDDIPAGVKRPEEQKYD